MFDWLYEFTKKDSNHIEITLTGACTVMCSYCPQTSYVKNFRKIGRDNGALSVDQSNMTLDTFKLVLKNIGSRTKKIFFTGFTEPIQHPNWFDFVKTAIDANYQVHFNTTLIGATRQDVDQLVSFDIPVRVHLTDSNQKLDTTLVDHLLKNSRQKIEIDSFSEQGNSLMRSLEVNRWTPDSRGKNVTELVKKTYTGPVYCVNKRQYSNVVLPNGLLVVCCSDFSLDHVLGDLKKQTLEEIHQSEEMRSFNSRMRSGDKDFICNSCHYARPLGSREFLERQAGELKGSLRRIFGPH